MPTKNDTAVPVRVIRETYDLISEIARREQRTRVAIVDRAVRLYAERMLP